MTIFLRDGLLYPANIVAVALAVAAGIALAVAMHKAGTEIWVSALTGSIASPILLLQFHYLAGNALGRVIDTHLNGGEIERGLKVCTILAKFQPMNHRAIGMRGEALMHLGRYEEAITELEKAIGLGPRYPRHFQSLAWCRALSGDVERAIQTLDVALMIEPRFISNWQIRGSLKSCSGRFDEAIEDFDTAIELACWSIDHHYCVSGQIAYDTAQFGRIAFHIQNGDAGLAEWQLANWDSHRNLEPDKSILQAIATSNWPPPQLPDLPSRVDDRDPDQLLVAVCKGVISIEDAELRSPCSFRSQFIHCAFYYMLGEIAFATGREDLAIDRYKRVLQVGLPIGIAYGLAQARLVRLGVLPPYAAACTDGDADRGDEECESESA